MDADVEYAAYAYDVDRGAERGTIPYWFPDFGVVMEICSRLTLSATKRKAQSYANRFKKGVQVVKITWNLDESDFDEEIIETYTPDEVQL